MSYRQLFIEVGATITSIVCTGTVLWSEESSQKNFIEKAESSKQRVNQKMLDTEQSFETKINLTEHTLEKRIEENKLQLWRGISQVQEIASGAPLIVLDNPRKYPIMQARLATFGACVRGDSSGKAAKMVLGGNGFGRQSYSSFVEQNWGRFFIVLVGGVGISALVEWFYSFY